MPTYRFRKLIFRSQIIIIIKPKISSTFLYHYILYIVYVFILYLVLKHVWCVFVTSQCVVIFVNLNNNGKLLYVLKQIIRLRIYNFNDMKICGWFMNYLSIVVFFQSSINVARLMRQQKKLIGKLKKDYQCFYF